MKTDRDLYLFFDGYDELKPYLDGSDEDVLLALRKPTLVRVRATEPSGRARLVAALLHGNEDSGYRAALELLRAGERFPFELWVFLGNLRAAYQDGWFAHRYLDGQEDFNRVWGLGPPTTRMRRCADAVLAALDAADLEGAIDIHNNTGDNPFYVIVPDPTPESLTLAAGMAGTILRWPLRAHTFMEVLSQRCPAVSVECGLPGVAAHHVFAASALRRFLTMDTPGHAGPGDAPPAPEPKVFEMQHRVVVRPEVPFTFGGQLGEDLDLVLTPGLDGHNFGMMLAGTVIGQVAPGAAMPLLATDMRGRETTERFFAIRDDGRLVITEDLTPVMLTTTVQQVRRDCLCYWARRRS